LGRFAQLSECGAVVQRRLLLSAQNEAYTRKDENQVARLLRACIREHSAAAALLHPANGDDGYDAGESSLLCSDSSGDENSDFEASSDGDVAALRSPPPPLPPDKDPVPPDYEVDTNDYGFVTMFSAAEASAWSAAFTAEADARAAGTTAASGIILAGLACTNLAPKTRA
jgi:hypothetical protein